MTLVGQIGGPAYAVAVQANYAYLGIGPRLWVLDVSNPAHPTVVSVSEEMPDYVSRTSHPVSRITSRAPRPQPG